MTTHHINLSTTEPYNHVGLIKIRQDDVNSQTLVADIIDNNQLRDFTGLHVFMNARIPGQPIVLRDKVTEIDYESSRISYTLIDSFWQKQGRIKAWFSFEGEIDGIPYRDSVANFEYTVIEGNFRNIKQGNYIWEFEQILQRWESIESLLGTEAATKLAMRMTAVEDEFGRLDQEVQNNFLAMTNKFNQSIDKLENSKVDKTIYTSEMAKKADQSWVDAQFQAIVSGAPKGTFSTVAALTAAYPSGTDGVFLVLADNHWYYWNEVTKKWTGGGVYQGVVLSDDSVTTPKVKDGNVTFRKLTKNIFPYLPENWGVKRYRFGIAQRSDYIIEDYPQSYKMYRFDMNGLIKVAPGMLVKISNTNNGNFKAAIWEYDFDRKGVRDSGYVEEHKLSDHTEYIKLIVATRDNTLISLREMLEKIDIVIEVEREFALNEIEVLSDVNHLKNLTAKNLIENDISFWRNGEHTVVNNRFDKFINSAKHLVYKSSHYIFELQKYRSLYYSILDPYEIAFYFIDSTFNVLKDLEYVSAEGIYTIPDTTIMALPIVKRKDGLALSPEDIKNMRLIVAFKKISFSYSEDDKTELLSQPASEEQFGFNEKVRYVGHSGTGYYAPENTLEALYMAKEMGMWAAECDVKLTKDNQLVLMHDFSVDRTTDGRGKVRDLTVSSIKDLLIIDDLKGFAPTRVPTFENFLIKCKQLELFPIVEATLSNNEYMEETADALLAQIYSSGLEKHIIVISFNINILRYLRSKTEKLRLALILKVGEKIDDRIIKSVKEIGNCAVNFYGTIDTAKQDINLLKNKNITTMAWTIDDPEVRDHLVSLGTDIITTNIVMNPNKEYRTEIGFFETIDSGETWQVLKNDYQDYLRFTLSIETQKIIVNFNTHLKQVMLNMTPLINCYDVGTGNQAFIIKSTIQDGQLILTLFKGESLVNPQELSVDKLKVKIEFNH